LGASIFEKHFTMDHALPGPDHWFSENPVGLKTWIAQIREARVALGSAIVRPTEAEKLVLKDFRRVIVAATDISRDDLLSEQNLTMRRVAGGVGAAPSMLPLLIGRLATRAYAKGEPISV
jgi:N-acetylneuraminate synthase/N,N'-diacetyllegionaminate synthase